MELGRCSFISAIALEAPVTVKTAPRGVAGCDAARPVASEGSRGLQLLRAEFIPARACGDASGGSRPNGRRGGRYAGFAAALRTLGGSTGSSPGSIARSPPSPSLCALLTLSALASSASVAPLSPCVGLTLSASLCLSLIHISEPTRRTPI
eukprot:2056898-Pleurochrysis_carterae.AAC.2